MECDSIDIQAVGVVLTIAVEGCPTPGKLLWRMISICPADGPILPYVALEGDPSVI
jgi:hypothetical protein